MSDELIKVTVTFSIGKKPPFHQAFPGATTVGQILAEARNYFEAKDEPNVVWYLSAHDERQNEATTLAEVAGKAEAVSFRLVKEITQG